MKWAEKYLKQYHTINSFRFCRTSADCAVLPLCFHSRRMEKQKIRNKGGDKTL
jgi:hypothetical protein